MSSAKLRLHELMLEAFRAHQYRKSLWREKSRKHSKITAKEVSAALDRFYETHNKLFSFLESLVFTELSENNEQSIDLIIDFLEMDIPAFRTGYAKEWIYQKLKKLSFSEKQKMRFQEMAISICQQPTLRREFAYLCRLMIKLAEQDFIERLIQLKNTSDGIQKQKAEKMLDVIRVQRKDLRNVGEKNNSLS